MGTNMTIDEKLLEEACEMTGLTSDIEVVERVLSRFIEGRYKHKNRLDLVGKIEFYDGFDSKALR